VAGTAAARVAACPIPRLRHAKGGGWAPYCRSAARGSKIGLEFSLGARVSRVIGSSRRSSAAVRWQQTLALGPLENNFALTPKPALKSADLS